MAPTTVRLAGVGFPDLIAAEDVLSVRDRFKVGWVHARPVATEMIEFKPFGHRPNESLV